MKSIKRIFCKVLLFILLSINGFGQTDQLKSFPLSSVRLLESPFLQAQQADMKYILALDPDRLLAPFEIDAGLTPKADRYGNWESIGLDGHTGGHYLSALAFMYAATGNEELLKRLDYMLKGLALCQEKNDNGYVSGIPGGKEMFRELTEGKFDAGSFTLANRWVPLYNIHKLFAGLRDAYLVAGKDQAREILIPLTEWFYSLSADLTDEQIQSVLRTEHGGLNEVFADVYAITGDPKYLTLAQRYSHRFILDPLLAHRNELTGLHANTQIPKVIGFKRIADLSGKQEWSDAAAFFWDLVIQKWTVSIGGNSVREHFHLANDFSSMVESTQGPETCNTYNMLRLTKLLFMTDPEARYINYVERALYNHILSSEHPDSGGFVYFTPMRPRHYRVYSQPQVCFWCCVGTGMENHGKYGEMIYAHSNRDLFVNLFIPSTLEWKEKGITLTQQTGFPYEEVSELKLRVDEPKQFTLNIRYPGWVKEGEMKIRVNGEAVPFTNRPNTYVSVERTWNTGDVVALEVPMHTTLEYLPDGSSWASVLHGPIVLAAITDTTDIDGLWADGSRMGHAPNGPMYPVEEAPAIVSARRDFESLVTKDKVRPLTFTFTGLIYPNTYKALELVPFFTIHGARYMIYWPVISPDSLKNRTSANRDKEQEMFTLAARTVDHVAVGEQQPEAEHNFRGEGADAGIHNDRRWRHASGWFSYDLQDKKGEGRILRITYFGMDAGRQFDILVNDVLLTTVKSDGSGGNRFVDVDYTISEASLARIQNHTLTVKFVAHPGSIAGGIYGVRLMK